MISGTIKKIQSARRNTRYGSGMFGIRTADLLWARILLSERGFCAWTREEAIWDKGVGEVESGSFAEVAVEIGEELFGFL